MGPEQVKMLQSSLFFLRLSHFFLYKCTWIAVDWFLCIWNIWLWQSLLACVWRGGVSELPGPLCFFLFFCSPWNSWILTSPTKAQAQARAVKAPSAHRRATRNSHAFIMCANIPHSDCLKLVYFNYRLITLQYWGGFCHLLTWVSRGCTWVPPSWTPSASLPTPSLWAFPEHQLCMPRFMHRTCVSHPSYTW